MLSWYSCGFVAVAILALGASSLPVAAAGSYVGVAGAMSSADSCQAPMAATRTMFDGSPLHLSTRLARGEAAAAFTVGYDEAVMNDDDASNAPARDSAMLYVRHRGSWTGRSLSAPGAVVAGFQNVRKDTVFWSQVTVGGAGGDFASASIAGDDASRIACSILEPPELPEGRSVETILFEIKEYGRAGAIVEVIGEYSDDGDASLSLHRYLFRSVDGGQSWSTARRITASVHVAHAYRRIIATDDRLERELRSKLVLLPQPQ